MCVCVRERERERERGGWEGAQDSMNPDAHDIFIHAKIYKYLYAPRSRYAHKHTDVAIEVREEEWKIHWLWQRKGVKKEGEIDREMR